MPSDALQAAVRRLAFGESLSATESADAFGLIMSGEASVAQVAALLMALRVKGETADEVAGAAQAMRAAMVPIEAEDREALVDTCGTGGGSVTTFNISTAAALLAAGAGVRIAKHGNRSFTSRSGSADVLEALGVPLDATPGVMGDVLRRAGVVFMFAPTLHPAMRHVGPVRRELGLPTIMNLLGPLTNPARARRQVVGVSHPRLLDLVAGGLRELEHEHALVVHGEPGMDELSPIGVTQAVEVRDGQVKRFAIVPSELFDTARLDPAELRGGDPDYNAKVVEDVLGGRMTGAARAAVVLNAGAAIYVAGMASSLREGVAAATTALEEGKGIQALENLRSATKAAVSAPEISAD